MARVMGRVSVVGTRMMARSRGMILSTDEAAKVASMHQFFNFILECCVVLYNMAMVAVITAIFGHISIRGSGCLARRWDEVGL